MPTILAIETSSELASVALLFNDQLVAREAAGVQTHSQTVLPMVQALFAVMGISLAQCDAIAFGCGPGSFTGVRTACGIAQGLAFALDKPVLPINTLQAMAQACRHAHGACDVLTLLDARMGEVYWAQYRWLQSCNEWQAVIEPTLSLPSEVIVTGQVMACGNGLRAYASAFEIQALVQNGQAAITPHATCVAQLGQVAFRQGRSIKPEDASPLYLRNQIALTTQERLAKVAK